MLKQYEIHEVEQLIFTYETEFKKLSEKMVVVHESLAELYRIKNRLHKQDNLKTNKKQSKL